MCLVEAMVKGGRRWSGRGREGGGCRKRKRDRRERKRQGLYGRGARLKFLHTNGWQPKNQTKEERARGKNQEKGEGEGKSLSCRGVLRGAPTDVPRLMIDRYDWGLSNLQLVARHVRIIRQHASVLDFSLFSSPSPSFPPLKEIYARIDRKSTV